MVYHLRTSFFWDNAASLLKLFTTFQRNIVPSSSRRFEKREEPITQWYDVTSRRTQFQPIHRETLSTRKLGFFLIVSFRLCRSIGKWTKLFVRPSSSSSSCSSSSLWLVGVTRSAAGLHKSRVTFFWTVAHNVCGSSVWHLPYVTHPSPRTSRWRLDAFLEICGPLI